MYAARFTSQQYNTDQQRHTYAHLPYTPPNHNLPTAFNDNHSVHKQRIPVRQNVARFYHGPMAIPLHQGNQVHRKIESSSLWQQLYNEYITEQFTFTMNKTIIFSLIASFMFLGCVFFLGGFFVGASLNKPTSQDQSPEEFQFQPSQMAVVNGTPVNKPIADELPKNFNVYTPIHIKQKKFRPSPSIQEKINHQDFGG